MPILYKSSKFETYVYYVIFPVLIGVTTFFIFGIISYGNLSIFTMAILFIFFFVLILSVDSLYRLKYIEVTEDNILIKNLNKNKIVEFKDVEYVYNLININGTSLILCYKDTETQKSKVILVRPEDKAPLPTIAFPIYDYGSTELNITKFIREKAIKSNPNYMSFKKPRWFLYGL